MRRAEQQERDVERASEFACNSAAYAEESTVAAMFQTRVCVTAVAVVREQCNVPDRLS